MCLTPAALAGSPELTDGLCLYLPFEGRTTPQFCVGRPDVRVGGACLGAGRVGQGLRVVGTASAIVSSPGNFHRARGSLAFWHRPDWDPNAPFRGNRMLLKEGNFQLTWYGPKRILFFMTGTAELGKGFKWDYTVATQAPRQWRPGEWRHVAITWDAHTGAKRLYLDGNVASEGQTVWMRKTESAIQATLTLGSPEAQGGYDEWAVWDRILTPEEVALLASRPDAAAEKLKAKAPPDAPTPAPVRFELVRVKDARTTIVEPGQPGRVSVLGASCTGRALDLELRLSLVDAFDKELDTWRQRVRIDAKAPTPLVFERAATRLGAVKIRAEFDHQGRTFRRDLGGFAVWPKASCRPSADSFFGHHVNSWYAGAFIRQAERLGLSWQRGHDMLQATWMKWVMPEPGEPEWRLAEQIDMYRQSHISVLGTFNGTSWWAADPPRPRPTNRSAYPRGAMPRADAFEQYIRRVVTRFGKTIRVWEMWNEPEVVHFWRGTPEQFGRLARLACKTAKSVDPTCKVVVAGFTGAERPEWYERAGRHGAFDLCDAISFHGYAQTPADFRRKLDLFRGLASRYAPQGERTPLWDTEWSVHDTTFYTDADLPDLPPRRLLPAPSYLAGAARVVKTDARALGLGVARSFYYLHNAVRGARAYHSSSSMEPTYAPRPKLMARVAMEHLTRGFRPHKLVEQAAVHALVLAGADKTCLAVLWTPGVRDVTLAGPWLEGAEIFDLFANPVPAAHAGVRVTSTPIYIKVRMAAADLAARLEEEKHAP